jgi:hypothetical protein
MANASPKDAQRTPQMARKKRLSPRPPLNPSAQSLSPFTVSGPQAPLLIGLIALLA